MLSTERPCDHLLPAASDGSLAALAVQLASADDFVHHPKWYETSESEHCKELDVEAARTAEGMLEGLPVISYSPLEYYKPPPAHGGPTRAVINLNTSRPTENRYASCYQ
jgi:hypothetical protein